MIGTLESFKPLMIGEEHKTWKNQQGKTMFSFLGTIDGVTGIFSSTKNTGSFKAGEKVDYESKPPADGAKYPKFSLKKIEEKGSIAEQATRFNNMEYVRMQAMDMCISLSIRAFEELNREIKLREEIDKVADFFFKWVIKDVKDRDSMYGRKNSLLNAVDSIKHSALALKAEKPWGLIIALAEHYLEKSLSVKQTDNVPSV